MTCESPKVRSSGSGHLTAIELVVNGQGRDVPYALTDRRVIADIVDVLAFYGFEAHWEGECGRLPAAYADNGARAWDLLKLLNVIADVTDLETDR